MNLLHNVADDQGQISCGTGCSSDTGTYAHGTRVVLTATPGLLRFNGWSGACSGTDRTCTVFMTDNKSVHASFSLLLTGQHESAPATPPAPMQWRTSIDAPDATGHVTVNGAAIGGVGRAPATLHVPDAPGDIRVSGILTTGAGRPGTWRFDRQGATAGPARVKVLEGQVALVTPDAIVFRLRGHPGERVAFAIVRAP